LKGKCKGRSRKPLAEVYSQERPVARHFVWLFLSTRFANPKSLKRLVQQGISTW
jgi:hypothetical protein